MKACTHLPSCRNSEEFLKIDIYLNHASTLSFQVNVTITSKPGRSKETSSVAFEVLNLVIFNCLTSNINLFMFNCLTLNFCFPKSFASRKERLFIDARP